MGSKAAVLDEICIRKQILAKLSVETIARMNKTSRKRIQDMAKKLELEIKKKPSPWAKSYMEYIPETF